MKADERTEDKYSWAWDIIYDLMSDEPETVWILIKKILTNDSSVKVISRLSAGPLENFLVYHGDEYIDRVEEEVKRNPAFAKLSGGVWKNAINDNVWNRIQKVCDKSWDK